MSHPESPEETQTLAAALAPKALARTAIGGVLMGVANIIPGVSGGTMILALGLYERFVNAVADVTRLRFQAASLVFLAVLGLSAVAAIFAAVEPINFGLTHHQHIMFALFIGLTLGGVPMLWRELQPIRPRAVAGMIAGLCLMIGITFALGRLDLPANFLFLFVGGILGAAAMVLPGISGSYLLLALGLYFPITDGISRFKDALQAMDMGLGAQLATGVILPVGLGVVVGIAGLTNLIKAALRNAFDLTMGSLLGLLLGSVFFLYPFKAPGHKDPFEAAAPLTPANIAMVLVALAVGFTATRYASRMGGKSADKSTDGRGEMR